MSSIVEDELQFYPLYDDPLCAVLPEGHPLARRPQVTLPELCRCPMVLEAPGCDNDIQHLLARSPVQPDVLYSFRDDAPIMAFVRSGLGVTISQELVLRAFGAQGLEARPLFPRVNRTIGLAFSRTASSVVSRTLLQYLRERFGEDAPPERKG